MANSLEDLMKNTFAGEIAAGKHTAIIKHFQYVKNESNPDNSYILITFLIDNKREYKRNFFLRDMSILLSHTRRQLGRANEDIIPGLYLRELIEDKTELDIWFEYPTVATRTGPKRVQNIAWLPPVSAETDETPDFELPPM